MSTQTCVVCCIGLVCLTIILVVYKVINEMSK